MSMVQRWDRTGDYPYTSHGESMTVWAALIGCVILLIGANGAPLWKTFTVGNFLGAYLAVSVTDPASIMIRSVSDRMVALLLRRILDISEDQAPSALALASRGA